MQAELFVNFVVRVFMEEEEAELQKFSREMEALELADERCCLMEDSVLQFTAALQERCTWLSGRGSGVRGVTEEAVDVFALQSCPCWRLSSHCKWGNFLHDYTTMLSHTQTPGTCAPSLGMRPATTMLSPERGSG